MDYPSQLVTNIKHPSQFLEATVCTDLLKANLLTNQLNHLNQKASHGVDAEKLSNVNRAGLGQGPRGLGPGAGRMEALRIERC